MGFVCLIIRPNSSGVIETILTATWKGIYQQDSNPPKPVLYRRAALQGSNWIGGASWIAVRGRSIGETRSLFWRIVSFISTHMVTYFTRSANHSRVSVACNVIGNQISWGQIIGCASQYQNVKKSFVAFVSYIVSRRLAGHLNEKDWVQKDWKFSTGCKFQMWINLGLFCCFSRSIKLNFLVLLRIRTKLDCYLTAFWYI